MLDTEPRSRPMTTEGITGHLSGSRLLRHPSIRVMASAMLSPRNHALPKQRSNIRWCSLASSGVPDRGPDHPATLATRNNFGYVLAGQSRLAEAEIQYRAVLADRLRILGPEHPSTLASRHDIACTLAELTAAQRRKPISGRSWPSGPVSSDPITPTPDRPPHISGKPSRS